MGVRAMFDAIATRWREGVARKSGKARSRRKR
jgi:hypothetical protein